MFGIFDFQRAESFWESCHLHFVSGNLFGRKRLYNPITPFSQLFVGNPMKYMILNETGKDHKTLFPGDLG